MKIKQLVNALKNIQSPLSRDPNVPDDVTTDKTLKALRRQRRVQLEEIEKEQLRKQITQHNTEKDKALFKTSPMLRGKQGFAPKKIKKQGHYTRGKIL